MADHTTVEVTEIPKCDLCNDPKPPAHADARLPRYGSWANVCGPHFKLENCTLGLGSGQRYIGRDS